MARWGSRGWLICLTAAYIIVSSVHGEGEVDDGRKYVKDIREDDFHRFTKRPSVTIVYFFKRDQPHIRNFLEEYEKSAKLLHLYRVELGKVTCPEGDPEHEATEYCKEEGVEENVYAFRDGHELLALSLENTFDVNSIMSNVLQIVLLREVPILQTRKERHDFETKHKGLHDIIFSYQSAIGTYVHRVLMEVAFAYNTKYKFAITTEKTVIQDLSESGTGESAMVWILQCKSTTDNAPCPHSKYHDSMDLVLLARFLKVLNINLIHDIGTQEAVNPFEDYNLHVVAIYYDETVHTRALELAEHLKSVFYGVIGVLLVDVNHVDAGQFGYIAGSTDVPGVSVVLRSTVEPVSMEGEVTKVTTEMFVAQQLNTVLGARRLAGAAGEAYTDDIKERHLLADVDKQDDQVAEAVTRTQHIEPDRTYIPALTDKTFPKETKNRNLLIVFFYVTFDTVSMAFMRSYVEASHMLAKQTLYPLAGVDCFDWTDVCSKYNVTNYPKLRIYRKGKESMEYKGMLGAAPVVNLVKLLMADAPVYLASHQEVALFLDGLYPSIVGGSTVYTVLGLFNKDHKKELAAFKEAAITSHGTTLFGYTSPDITQLLCSKFATQAPSVVVYKRNDLLKPHHVFRNEMTLSNILDFIKEYSLPTFPEINTRNFPALYARRQPFVILFDEYIKVGSGAHQQVAAVAQSGVFPKFTFGWMELTRDDGVAGKVLLEYNQFAEPPALFLVSHQTGVIYNYGTSAIQKEALISWLSDVDQEKVKPWKKLEQGEWKPLNPGYDFLQMIDEETAEEAAQNKESKTIVDGSAPAVDEEAEMEVRRELHLLRHQSVEDQPPSSPQDPITTPHTEL